MPGTINTLQTWPTQDYTGNPNAPAFGIAFKSPSDGNIYIATQDTTLLALNKSTGAVVFATFTNNPVGSLAWDPASGNFLVGTIGAGNFQIALCDGAGTLLLNPATGNTPRGQIIVNGLWFGGDALDTDVTLLDAATGAPIGSIDTSPGVRPTLSAPQMAYDGSSVWMSGGTNAPGNIFLVQLNGTTGTLQNVYDMAAQGMGAIFGICFAQGKLYLSDISNRVFRVSLTGVVENLFSGVQGGVIIYDGLYLWVTGGGVTQVYTLDIGTGDADLQTFIPTDSNAHFVAHDPADAPGIVWVSMGVAAPFQVQQFQFVPFIPPTPTGGFFGTHVGFMTAGRFSGGTK